MSTMRKKLQAVAAFSLAALLALSCTGCGEGDAPRNGSSASEDGKTPSSPASQVSQENEKPVELEIMGFYDNNVSADDEVIQSINEEFNVKINPTIVSTDGYAEAVQMRIAADNYPDWLRNSEDLLYAQLLEDGKLVNVSEYIDKLGLKNLPSLLETPNAELLSEQDGFYRIPNYNGHLANGYYIRKDWLDKLNLKVPTTMEEFRDVLQKMVEADLDGKGTIGITCDWVGSVEYMMIGFTGFNTWKLENGEAVYSRTTDGFKEGLHYFNDLFENNLLDPELAINDYEKAIEKVATGRAAVLFRNINESWYGTVETALEAYDPNAELYVLVPFPQGPEGDVLMLYPGYGYTYIPAATTEDKREKLFQIIDYLASDEGKELTLYGVDDTFKMEENGETVQNSDAARENWGSQINFLGEMTSYGTLDLLTRNEQVIKFSEYQDQAGVANPAAFMLTDDSVELSTNIEEVFRKWLVSFLTGEKDIDENWDVYLQEMNEAGLEQYRSEVTEYLSRR